MASTSDSGAFKSMMSRPGGDHAGTRLNRADEDVSPLLVVFYPGQDVIAYTIGDCLCRAVRVVTSTQELDVLPATTLAAMPVQLFVGHLSAPRGRQVVVAHDVSSHRQAWESTLTSRCHFEYVYQQDYLDRRHIVQFLSHVLGQRRPHEKLQRKTRSTVLTMTFPDVSTVLPDLDILTIGADAVELQVDYLRDPEVETTVGIASLDFVRRQLMLLRQKTELPIIFTVGCSAGALSSSATSSSAVQRYLVKGLQWGCEYVEVASWLPIEVRKDVYARRGPTTIIASVRDTSGTVRWSSPEAWTLYKRATEYSSVVRMSILAPPADDEYELETFKQTVSLDSQASMFAGSTQRSVVDHTGLSFTTHLTAISHPLLPNGQDAGSMTAADINKTLHRLGNLPSLEIYSFGRVKSALPVTFLEKCFNELGLPYHLMGVEYDKAVDPLLGRANLGGVYFDTPRTLTLPDSVVLSSAARATGQVDTIKVRLTSTGRAIEADNATWRGIQAMLTRQHVPSAYRNRTALVLARSESDALCTIYALSMLNVGSIHTIGFECTSMPGVQTARLTGLNDLTESKQPLAVVNLLPGNRIQLLRSLLKHYGRADETVPTVASKVFLDLTEESSDTRVLTAAMSTGWISYNIDDVRAWTIMETIDLLVGQSVPYEFVRLACGSKSF